MAFSAHSAVMSGGLQCSSAACAHLKYLEVLAPAASFNVGFSQIRVARVAAPSQGARNRILKNCPRHQMPAWLLLDLLLALLGNLAIS